MTQRDEKHVIMYDLSASDRSDQESISFSNSNKKSDPVVEVIPNQAIELRITDSVKSKKPKTDPVNSKPEIGRQLTKKKRLVVSGKTSTK